MNSFGQRPPIYLVVDVAGPESEHRKLRLVNDILDELSAEAHANGIGSDDHVTVVLFAEAAEVAVSAAPLYGASLRAPWQIPLSIRRSRLSRSYIAVFDLLRREIGRTHGGTQDTVVVMVTDGTDPENWEPALDDLVSEFPGLTLCPSRTAPLPQERRVVWPGRVARSGDRRPRALEAGLQGRRGSRDVGTGVETQKPFGAALHDSQR